MTRVFFGSPVKLFLLLYSPLCCNWDWNCWRWSEGSSIIFFFCGCQRCDWISVIWSDYHASADRLTLPSTYWINGVISMTDLLCVCNAGKLDSLFPDDSYIDMGEIDVGRKVAQQIPPGIFWRSQVFIDHPMYLKFNVSLSKDALVGIYGRRGLPPSHTQVGNTCHGNWFVCYLSITLSFCFSYFMAEYKI